MCVSLSVCSLVNIHFSASWCVWIHELGNTALQYVKSEGTVNGEDGRKHTALTHISELCTIILFIPPLPNPQSHTCLTFLFSFLDMQCGCAPSWYHCPRCLLCRIIFFSFLYLCFHLAALVQLTNC